MLLDMRLSLVTPLTLKLQAVALIGFVVLLFARFPPEGSHRLDEEAEGSHRLGEEVGDSHCLDEEDVPIPAS